MTLVALDKQEIESLSPNERAPTTLALETAEKLCAYFQEMAKKRTAKDVAKPDFTSKEKKAFSAVKAMSLSFIASEETGPLKKAALRLAGAFNRIAAGKDGMEAGAMAYKLLLATQMDYFHDHPEQIEVFNIKSRAEGEKLLEKMERLSQELGQTVAPVDSCFDKSYQSFRQWAPELIAKLD